MNTVQDDLDQELLPLFLEEADELYPIIGEIMQAWHVQSEDALLARKFQRSLHTFKGSARMAGAMRVGEQVHQMEELATAPEVQRSAIFWKEMQSRFDRIGEMLEMLRTNVEADSVNHNMETSSEHLMPFACISKRLYRIVRQTGKELGKKANLELRGTEVRLNQAVLETMTAPFEHLLRNAIAHGLECPLLREYSGKPPIGEIRLSLRRESQEVVFEFEDDGSGLDIDGLRCKAVEMGLLQVNEATNDGQVMQLIFVPGLSTAIEITAISGRGVGMDVVRNEISALGGRISVLSKRGEGTRFTIRLPVAYAISGLNKTTNNLNAQNCEGDALGLQ